MSTSGNSFLLIGSPAADTISLSATAASFGTTSFTLSNIDTRQLTLGNSLDNLTLTGTSAALSGTHPFGGPQPLRPADGAHRQAGFGRQRPHPRLQRQHALCELVCRRG